MSTHRQRDSFNEINITPLTDIFLVLLIIMMVIAPLLDQQGLNLTVPTQHEAKKQEKQPKLITVNVSKDGQYTVDGQEVAENNLQSRIEEVFKEKKEGLLIRADQDSTHGAVVLVMDAAQQVGIQNVSVMEN